MNGPSPPRSFDAFADLIAELLRIERHRLTRDVDLTDDLGLDSVDLVELAATVEAMGLPAGAVDGARWRRLEDVWAAVVQYT